MPVEVTAPGSRGWKMPRAAIVLMGLIPRVYRLVNGRGMGGTLILTTVGVKTGKKRDAQLTLFPDGDAWLVVASKGGSATHPAWYLNMAAHPDKIWAQVGSRRVRVNADTLKGDARASAWQRITSQYSNYSDYEKKTDREIPVVRLTPVAERGAA
jgi:deazaflavin-dependent oxidoreductase (nitroreductase family)